MSDTASSYRMIDVGEKAVTRRRAVAEGEIRMGGVAFDLLASRKLPKGDPLALCEVAGVMAAKKTAEWIPLCHPLPVEKARVSTELDRERGIVRVRCEVVTSAKTGVEMEALTAVSAALLTIYDLVKGTDPSCEIGAIHLLEKSGGKSGEYVRAGARRGGGSLPGAGHDPHAVLGRQSAAAALAGIAAAVITVSDRCSRGAAQDRSGPALAGRLLAEGAEIIGTVMVPDERPLIAEAIRELTSKARLVLLTGGTGLGPRDVTPEAVSDACERMIPGFGERIRSEGARHVSSAYLSRSCAGLRGRALVIALPGSLKAVEEGWSALSPLLPHALSIAEGANHG